jgi:hypothetical protein
LSYGSIVVKSYDGYNINGFRFRSTIFEASRPLAATTNTGVVTRDVDAHGHESKYYGVIKTIIEYRFAGNKNLKIVFFDCDWFDPYHCTQENNFVWLKSNTRIDCVVVTHLSLLTRWSRFIICRTHEKS